jgi:hypothetical protein
MKYLKLLSLLVALATLGMRCGSDDPEKKLPTLSINSAAAEEGMSATFTVTLSEASSEQVVFQYKTSNGTTSDDDYRVVKTLKALTIAPGVTSVEIEVDTYADELDESSETFTVILSNAQNAEISVGEGTGTINNGPVPFFLKVKIDGEWWTATQAYFFEPTFINNSFAAYGAGSDYDSQLSFVLKNTPTGPATYATGDVDDDTHVRAYYTPDFFSGGGFGTVFQAQEGGELQITVYDEVEGVAVGTFHFTAKDEDGNIHELTEGRFRIKVENF